LRAIYCLLWLGSDMIAAQQRTERDRINLLPVYK